MASKVKVQDGAETALEAAETTTALALVGGGGAMAAKEPGGSFLPSLKFIWPIECGQDIPLKFGYHFAVSDGQANDYLVTPWSVVAIASRNAARKVIYDTSKPVNPKTGKHPVQEYERAYDAWRGNAKSAARFNEMVAAEAAGDNDYLIGASYLVAVLVGEEVTIAQCDAFKSISSYVGKVFYQATLESKLRADIQVIDHSVNLVTSKNGGEYPGSKKFRQFRIEPLTDKQAEAISVAIGEAEDGIRGWIGK